MRSHSEPWRNRRPQLSAAARRAPSSRWSDIRMQPDDDRAAFGLDALADPAHMFGHPAEVAAHPSLTCEEKRAILAAWASDACAIEAAPALRRLPGSPQPVTFDEIMDALRALDDGAPLRLAI